MSGEECRPERRSERNRLRAAAVHRRAVVRPDIAAAVISGLHLIAAAHGQAVGDRGHGRSVLAEPAQKRTAPAALEAIRHRVLAHAALKPGMVVAEIGVGGGWFVFRAAEAVGPDGVVYGTDIDPESIHSLQRHLKSIRPGAGRVEFRLCRDGRDTALDDLPEGRIDVILMVDSLCFDSSEPRQRNVDYLRRFFRLLRPGGRLIHHMDCGCEATEEAVVAQFADAGFRSRIEYAHVPADHVAGDPDWHCRSAEERRRHAFIGIFSKPGEP